MESTTEDTQSKNLWWQAEANRSCLDACINLLNEARRQVDEDARAVILLDALKTAAGAFSLCSKAPGRPDGNAKDTEGSDSRELLLKGISSEGQSALLAKLVQVLCAAGSDSASSLINSMLEETFEVLWERPAFRLASYGTLRPGESNHKIVADIQGNWVPGFVLGTVVELHGYPVFEWNNSGEKIPVEVLISEELPANWARIDEFEGVTYERILIPVHTENGIVICNLYNLSPAAREQQKQKGEE